MRFLQLFFRLFAVTIIGGLIVAVAGRELWLFAAAQNIARTAQQLTQTNRWQPYFSQCQDRIITDASSPVLGMQLRFLNDREYVIEVACEGQQAAEVQRSTLPMGVRKSTGSPGFSYDIQSQTLSGEMTLQFFRQNRIVYIEGETAGQQWGKTDLRSGIPASQCAAHGLRCCPADEYEGVGLPQADGVLDCPGGCFDSCLRRPILLSFQSDPSISPSTREVVIQGTSGLVLFAYTFDDTESDIQAVTIDYGDGTAETLTSGRGEFEKEFVCTSGQQCRFVVTLQATDVRGVSSPATRLSTLTVVVTP